jgi:hypothetical protein
MWKHKWKWSGQIHITVCVKNTLFSSVCFVLLSWLSAIQSKFLFVHLITFLVNFLIHKILYIISTIMEGWLLALFTERGKWKGGYFTLAKSKQTFLLKTPPTPRLTSFSPFKASTLNPMQLVHSTQFRITLPLRTWWSEASSKCISHSRRETLASTTFNMLCATRSGN